MLRRVLPCQSERRVERRALNRGQLGHAPAHRAKELMQPGKGKIRFRLDARRREHRHAPFPRRPGNLGQQPRLAHTGPAANHQRLTVSRDLAQDCPQKGPLLVATQQGSSFIARGEEHGVLILSRRTLGGRPREAALQRRSTHTITVTIRDRKLGE